MRQRRRLSEAQYKSYTILTRGLSSAALAKEEARKLHPASFYYAVTSGQRKLTSSQATKGSDFIHLRTRLRWTSKQGFWNLVKMSRLHCITPWQGRKPSVLSEELLLA